MLLVIVIVSSIVSSILFLVFSLWVKRLYNEIDEKIKENTKFQNQEFELIKKQKEREANELPEGKVAVKKSEVENAINTFKKLKEGNDEILKMIEASSDVFKKAEMIFKK